MNHSNLIIRFILRLIIHATILICVFSLFVSLVFVYATEKRRLILPSNKKILILGNSHPECALDDRLNVDFHNLSRSAEPLYYTHLKLKRILEWNPHLSHVFVELTENQFEYRMQDWIWSREAVQRHIKELLFYLPLEYHYSAIGRHGLYYCIDFLLALKTNLVGLFTCKPEDFFDYVQWGGYTPRQGTYLGRNNKSEWNKSDEKLNPFPDNFKSIEQMISLCDLKGAKIQFIRCPVHPSQPKHFEKAYQQIVKENQKIQLLDFNNYPLEDECFFDAQHLNETGARLFTAHFTTMLLSEN